MFVAIEGIDGAGKTTIGRALADKLCCLFVEKSLMSASGLTKQEYTKMREDLKKSNFASDKLMTLFFGMNNILCSELSRRQSIVADRYIATNYFWYGNELTEPFYKALVQVIDRPSLTVVLDVSVDLAISRIMQRKFASKEEKALELAKAQLAGSFTTKVVPFLEKHNYKYIIIENNDTVECITDRIISSMATTNQALT